jgi:hypothetical protein
MSRRRRDDVLNEIGFQFRAMQTEFEDHDAAIAQLLGLNSTDMRVLDFLGRTGNPASFESAPTTAGDLARPAASPPARSPRSSTAWSGRAGSAAAAMPTTGAAWWWS